MTDRMIRCLLATVLAAAALGATSPAGAAETTVKARDNFFTPAYKVISVGDSVTWVNEGADRHTVTSYEDSPQQFDSSPETVATCDDGSPLTSEDCMEPGQEFGPIEFTTPGTYSYRCKVHGDPMLRPDKDAGGQEQPCGMCGIIRVVEERKDDDQPRRDPTPPTRVETRRTRSPSPSASPSESPTLDERGSPIAAPAEGDGGGGRLLLALVLLTALGGAGYWTWRTYLS